MMGEVDSLTEKLGKTISLKEEGVSFAGRGLSWNNTEDAQVVVDEINKCSNMKYLNLEGNTLGVEAAEAIAKALESKSTMKKALWKDLFTGRKKHEIPEALKHLSRGLMKANARLEVLDLSDNASGPIGAEGIVDLIRSPTCYTLKELKLNNMGLGIAGAKILANALKDCYDNSLEAGSPLALRVFIAGRNRLEDDGSTALAKVFEKMGSLEEIQVPQNGIYFPGISALSKAFANNPNLREINLNDNTLNPKGAFAVSESLCHLKELVKLDLGDCLIKNDGALHLAKALEEGHPNLQEVIVSFDAIKTEGALAIFNAVSRKHNFKILQIDGNNFGPEGIEQLQNLAEDVGKISILGPLSEDEGPGSDESYADDDDDDDDDRSDYEEYNSGESDLENGVEKEEVDSENYEVHARDDVESDPNSQTKTGNAGEFLKDPTEDNFMKLGDSAVTSIIHEIKDTQESNSSYKNGLSQSTNVTRFSFSEVQDMLSTLVLTEKSSPQKEDSCDIVAKLVASKLRQMNQNVSLLAEKLINQVLYEGLLGNLNPNSRLVVDPQLNHS